MTTPPPPPSPAPPPPSAWQPPSLSPIDRVRAAYQRRAQTDYYFSGPGMNIFLAVITCGIYGLYLFYQLMRRDRDHNLRRYEMLDAANTLAWEQAQSRGIAEELRPAFERNAASLETLRRLTTEFRDPAIWLVISIFASLAQTIGFIFIDQDLDKHDRAEGAIEAELAVIFERFGQTLPQPDPSRLKGQQNYVGRVLATVFTCGIYHFWWLYDMEVEGNRHLEQNWPIDDALMNAAQGLAA
jgi:hypothetical protein